jgi:hypothetical protein
VLGTSEGRSLKVSKEIKAAVVVNNGKMRCNTGGWGGGR